MCSRTTTQPGRRRRLCHGPFRPCCSVFARLATMVPASPSISERTLTLSRNLRDVVTGGWRWPLDLGKQPDFGTRIAVREFGSIESGSAAHGAPDRHLSHPGGSPVSLSGKWTGNTRISPVPCPTAAVHMAGFAIGEPIQSCPSVVVHRVHEIETGEVAATTPPVVQEYGSKVRSDRQRVLCRRWLCPANRVSHRSTTPGKEVLLHAQGEKMFISG